MVNQTGLVFILYESGKKKTLLVIVRTDDALELLLRTFRELARGRTPSVRLDKTDGEMMNVEAISLGLKKKSFYQFITETGGEVHWAASPEDWKDNAALLAAFLSGQSGHHYFGSFGSDIFVEISYKEPHELDNKGKTERREMRQE